MVSFIIGAKKFVGTKPGQSLNEFAAEVRKLTQADREEMAPLLSEALGEEVSVELASSKK